MIVLKPVFNYLFRKRKQKLYSKIAFTTEIPVIEKPVHWFALQIIGLVSIW